MTTTGAPGRSGAPETPAPPPESAYGFPRALWRGLGRIPVPPPLTPRTWRSPLRGPWLTSVFGVVLLVGLPSVILTGLLSYIAYGPQFGQAIPADVGYLRLPLFDWPTSPSWLYRLTQGLHVGLGFVLVPVVLAKLWSVVPKLFAWPPVRSIAQLLERISLLALVGGILFELVTGIMNVQYDYSFGFDFYTAHYWGAWVFIGGFVAHVAIKLPTMVRSLRTGGPGRWLHDTVEDTVPEPPDDEPGHSLVATSPSPPTMSRRTLIGTVAGGSALVGVLTIGTTVDALRPLALLSPRGRSYGTGPNDFQVNRTAFAAGIGPGVGDGYALVLRGGAGGEVRLDRAALAGMPQHTATLPIACVEGWSQMRTWSGVRLRDLAALAGVPAPVNAFVQSLERAGPFARTTLQANQVLDPDSLLALRVGDTDGGPMADLSLDHGFPARVIVPALPGVHNTKWVGAIDFRSA
ncbi:molybdopterin-dependent oxidoreductase-like protein [Actinomycetospora succinea]|uniref:Molybdopterin-dependent oxidoreductase-like protein n=1 Tax=Actinomycetospora succinea TaxID=663603 RepID=A0A4R6VL79_9PSEU|nr:molybdopterin-dependent oxidoreductase [Actinomycetospora succinea]TDQ62652.1 molybdopterin-dependent oxidoreductase-like protein [Actinomycetospora succinea]